MHLTSRLRSTWVRLLRGCCFCAVAAVSANAIATTDTADTAKANARERVFQLAARVSPQDGRPLSSDERDAFERDLSQLGYDDLIEATERLEPPPGEIKMDEQIRFGEPLPVAPIPAWQEPAKLLSHRLLEIAPRHTFRWIHMRGLENLKWRVAGVFLEELAKTMPELAWDETKAMYAKWWPHFDGTPLSAYVPVGFVFGPMEGLPGKPARRMLLDGSYLGEPFAVELQIDALMRMLQVARSEDALVDFLNWKVGAGKPLVEKVHRFSLDIKLVSPETTITGLGLALLAKENPRRAITWGEENAPRLPTHWRLCIYSGWVDYHPKSKDEMAMFKTRRSDAIEWLAEELEPDSQEIEGAFSVWRWSDLKAAETWLAAPGGTQKVVKAKEWLRVQQWPPIRSN